jgi:hypothetical protein
VGRSNNRLNKTAYSDLSDYFSRHIIRLIKARNVRGAEKLVDMGEKGRHTKCLWKRKRDRLEDLGYY